MENIEKIKEKLNTKLLGKNMIYLKEIDSTQEYIKRSKDELKEGTVVIAEKQTKGKGTKSRKWYSKGGENLTFSILLKPNCDIKCFENLTIKTAETIVNTIKKLYGYKLYIKYPNDIMLNGKKLGGILTESFTMGEVTKNIIIRDRN